MKHKMTIEFASAEDCAWAQKQIARAQRRTKEMLPYGGTPLEGGSASILLTALGRAVKVTSKTNPDEVLNLPKRTP